MEQKYSGLILSGLPGSGKSTLAKELGFCYGWSVFSIGQLFREEYDKKRPLRDISFDEFWKKTSHDDNVLMDSFARGILEKGNVIGDLRYGVIGEGLPLLQVFINAPLQVRANRCFGNSRYSGMSVDMIADNLLKREFDESARGVELYGKSYDYRDPSRYHVVLNSGKLSVLEEANVLKSLIESR